MRTPLRFKLSDTELVEAPCIFILFHHSVSAFMLFSKRNALPQLLHLHNFLFSRSSSDILFEKLRVKLLSQQPTCISHINLNTLHGDDLCKTHKLFENRGQNVLPFETPAQGLVCTGTYNNK